MADLGSAVHERARARRAAREPDRRGRLQDLALEEASEVDGDVVAVDLDQRCALLGLFSRQAGQGSAELLAGAVTMVTVASAHDSRAVRPATRRVRLVAGVGQRGPLPGRVDRGAAQGRRPCPRRPRRRDLRPVGLRASRSRDRAGRGRPGAGGVRAAVPPSGLRHLPRAAGRPARRRGRGRARDGEARAAGGGRARGLGLAAAVRAVAVGGDHRRAARVLPGPWAERAATRRLRPRARGGCDGDALGTRRRARRGRARRPGDRGADQRGRACLRRPARGGTEL